MSGDKQSFLKKLIPEAVKNAPTFSKKLYELFLSKNSDSFLQFFRYFFVGGISFVVDTVTLMIVSYITDVQFIYVSAGFAVGVTANYLLSRLMVFQDKQVNRTVEFTVVLIISIIGLWLTNLLFSLFMFCFAFVGSFWCKLISKVLSAALVLIWNFCARKVFYYFIDRRASR